MNPEVIGIVGLGYVGLPLAIEFGKKFKVIGFDLSGEKVDKCINGIDPSGELSSEQLAEAKHAIYTTNPTQLKCADIVIVAVPTPVDHAHVPDFTPLISASSLVGSNLKRGATIIYESTVYPGATEDICIPILEKESRMKWKTDFSVGYSPERINPGDRERTLSKVVKIVSGDSQKTLELVYRLYKEIVQAGVYRCQSIKIAEAAKVIENTQRDLNIALMNELSIIFHKIGIDTTSVLEAAGTKWNFLKFSPGLVGGHCIGVDPYYLTYKSEMLGYHPQVILAGRRINDGMGKYVVEQVVKQLISIGSPIKGAKVNLLGLTFKEDCADLRNSRVKDIIAELNDYGISVTATDPLASSEEVMHEFGIKLTPFYQLSKADALIVAVAHKSYKCLRVNDMQHLLADGGVLVDVKSCLSKEQFEGAGFKVWRL